jgi:carbohydrate kinase (thermoresistant glucokinase family)
VIIALMGVSGSGKTTVAAALADQLGWTWQEGDALHPPQNVAKMHAGIPLDDTDRWPWLRKVAEWVDARRATGKNGIITCSLLKRAYREIVIGKRPDVRLMFLRGSRHRIGEHIAHRTGHFMPTSLLDSQFATLEEPAAEEHAIIVEVSDSIEDTVMKAMDLLRKADIGDKGPRD